MNGDERISFTVASVYLFLFFLSCFLFGDWLPLQILGGTAVTLGAMLLTAAVLNPGKLPRKHSRYTRTWYLISFLFSLLALLALRNVAHSLTNHIAAISIIYGTLILLLIIFRKAMMQVVMIFMAIVFISVIAANWPAAVAGELTFMDALRESGRMVFRVRPIKDVADTLIAGNYMNYLNKVDYRDEELNVIATRAARLSDDDALRKTLAILDFVSNEIHYVSDPNDGVEHAKKPMNTIRSGGGDCEDQTVLLCSLLESVGVKTYMAFTRDHVFAYVAFDRSYPELENTPRVRIDGRVAYMLDAADPNARVGFGAARPERTERVFDTRLKQLVPFEIPPEG